MFGFIKNLLRRPMDSSVEHEQADTPPREIPTGAALPGYTSQRPRFTPPPAPARRAPTHQNGRGVELPLQKIIEGLPLELQPRVRMPDVGGMTVSVPLEKILSQLSRGVVKVCFGELRQAAPEVFTVENDRDRVLVQLPLAEILARLNPALITRRRAQRQVEVPADVSSPFDAYSQQLTYAAEPLQPEAEPEPASPVAAPRFTTFTPVAPPSPALAVPLAMPPAPPSLPKPKAMPPRHTLTSAPTPAAPTAFAKTPIPKTAAPAPAGPSPSTTFTPPPLPAPVVAPQPAPARAPVTPPIPAADAAPRLSRELKPPANTPTAASAPAPAKPAAPQEPLMVALAALAEGWPDAVRKEIIELNLVDARVALPTSAVEQALKQGRIAFSWKSIRSWIKPAILPAVSAHDGIVLELPLKVVAPLFLARQRESAKPASKVAVDEEIPNLFFGFPQQEGATPVAQATARPADTNYYVWDDAHDTVRVHESEVKRGPTPGTKFVAKYATPNEIVSRAAALDGVAGVIIALPDGLMVANSLPADINADTLAAFLPQIFGKVSACTKELRMGELNNLNFTVGNVPWKIHRVNAIFFAVFGRTGEPLPTAQLAALAAELDHKPK